MSYTVDADAVVAGTITVIVAAGTGAVKWTIAAFPWSSSYS